MHQTISILVSGKVQGVFFRQSTKETALRLNITGEVKNLDNGKVEIQATGTKKDLDEFVSWCRQGPPKAIVKEVQVHVIPLKVFKDFIIIRF
ncbi:MAG: acylphosphatase [Bacteroidetes bacterium]|nr:acylphosphatase [Bacteroidota bacterium]MBS1930303.1 acylphosphatase [Bacteroidota bacterium]